MCLCVPPHRALNYCTRGKLSAQHGALAGPLPPKFWLILERSELEVWVLSLGVLVFDMPDSLHRVQG